MFRTFSRLCLPLGAAAALLVGATPAMAGGTVDPAPVGPNQFFTGLVNGASGLSRIAVMCDGPIDFVPTGHPVAGQTLEVVPADPAGVVAPGFTGSAARAIGVRFAPASLATPPVVLRFYRTIAQIPTDILVPCTGAGAVSFVPTPSTPTARTATVKVTFVTKS